MVVGQVAGVEALAALGAVDFLMWVVTGISTGLTQGFSIQLSQYYGAKDFENLPNNHGIHHCIKPVSYTHLDVYKRQSGNKGLYDSRCRRCGKLHLWMYICSSGRPEMCIRDRSMIFPKHRKNMLSNPELILSETENLVLKIIC